MCTEIIKNELILNSDYTDRLLELIDQAKEDICVMMFDWRWYRNDFSCDVSLINQSLVRAKRRGVSIRLLLNSDLVQNELSTVGFQVKHWKADKLMHAKLFIIDKAFLICGSHNLTENALSRNIEVSLLTNDGEQIKKARDYFESLWSL